MKLIDTAIADVKILIPTIHQDNRGYFYESFNQREFNKLIGRDVVFVQDNHSKSHKGVLRGLHYQEAPMAQGKLVRVVLGEVYDVVVDLRPDSMTYKKWISHNLSAKNHHQLWIPEGFAHGFYVLSDQAEVQYKTTNYYSPEYERCIAWNSGELDIEWPAFEKPTLSVKDKS